MANKTVRGALQIHGANPQTLVEQVIRNRIYESQYWKEHCFALTAESLIDKAIELKYIGGVYANQKPTEFMCLLLKLLQIQPEKEILVEYLLAEEFKYLRALAAMYIRMTFRAVDVFELLEPLLKDYRKLRKRSTAGFTLTYMDDFADELLTEERVCDIILPRLTKREVLEETEGLGPRSSALLKAMMESGSEDETTGDPGRKQGKYRSKGAGGSSPSDASGGSDARSRSRSGSAASRKRYVSRSPSRSRSRERSPPSSVGSPRYRSRSRSISADRIQDDQGDVEMSIKSPA